VDKMLALFGIKVVDLSRRRKNLISQKERRCMENEKH